MVFLGSNFDQVITRGMEEGGENLTKVLYGRFRLKVQPLTLLYTIFDRKDPFRLRSIDKCYPFHPHSLEIWTPFLTAVNALSLKHELITKLESFMDFFTSIKRICRPFWAFLQTEMTDFPTLLSVASISDSLPYHIPDAWQRYPFRVESNLLLV